MTDIPTSGTSIRTSWIGVLFGIAYGLVLRLAATEPVLRAVKIPQIVSFSFILLMPVATACSVPAFQDVGRRAKRNPRVRTIQIRSSMLARIAAEC